MAAAKISVAKIGGSLLSLSDLPGRLTAWLATERSARSETHFVLVAGGGRLVDVLREIDARIPLGDHAAHRIAIELMDAAAQIVGAMVPEWFATNDFGELRRRATEPGITLFRPSRFMAEVEPACPGRRLPASWAVTSDSIAARLAIVIAADELVLLKSAARPEAPSPAALNHWSDAGYVDEFLPLLAAELKAIRVVVP